MERYKVPKGKWVYVHPFPKQLPMLARRRVGTYEIETSRTAVFTKDDVIFYPKKYDAKEYEFYSTHIIPIIARYGSGFFRDYIVFRLPPNPWNIAVIAVNRQDLRHP